jgi:hypothetical protein
MVGTVRGLNRFEVWVDSRNTSSNEGEITDTEYRAMLTQEGQETLAGLGMTTKYEGTVMDVSYREYGSDFFLGDLVQVENDYGISAKTRIVEVIENEEGDGENTIITFADSEIEEEV